MTSCPCNLMASDISRIFSLYGKCRKDLGRPSTFSEDSFCPGGEAVSEQGGSSASLEAERRWAPAGFLFYWVWLFNLDGAAHMQTDSSPFHSWKHPPSCTQRTQLCTTDLPALPKPIIRLTIIFPKGPTTECCHLGARNPNTSF